jgi:hypothetical protein
VTLLYVTVEGKAPIVLINEDNVKVPGAPLAICFAYAGAQIGAA